MRKVFLLAMILLLSAMGMAQERKISGMLVDSESAQPIAMATIQMLKPDSTFVKGTLSDEKGKFVLQVVDNGPYLIKMSSVGYVPVFRRVHLRPAHGGDMGRVTMKPDAVMLKEAQVTARALKVSVREDTVVYNSAAFRTPEGSAIEELVKRLPGARVDDQGKITINGKEVKKILVDGKEFMTGDTKMALKNIPTSIVDKIKAYDQKSDLSRVTGIDDGEEETVLDFGVKAGMNRGLMGHVDVGAGSRDRYAAKLFGGYFNNGLSVLGMGNANNVSDIDFGGGRAMRGRNGLNASKTAGLNMNYEKPNVLKADGSVRWEHRDGDVLAERSVEHFVSRSGAFSNSRSRTYSRSNNWNAQARIEWMPDTMTNILFRTNASLATSDGLSSVRSASYTDDPYAHVADPLSPESADLLAAKGLMVNAHERSGISYGEQKSFGAMLQYNRRLNDRGRNLTLRAGVDYGDSESDNLSISNVHLYRLTGTTGADSAYQINRYMPAPGTNRGYSLQATYSEPLWKNTFLQFRYQFRYNYSRSDRSTYDFSNLGEHFFAGVHGGYRAWDGFLERLERPYVEYLDSGLSRFSEYRNYRHVAEMMFRMIRAKYQLSAGMMLQPQSSKYRQDYRGVSVDTVRRVFNMSPTFDFRYRLNKLNNFRINYRANTTQPSISQLLDIHDDADPLNISVGNPGLKPSFTQNLRLFYNGYFASSQRSLMTHLRLSTTSNSISNKVTYDEHTGGRTIRPENINGDWSLHGVVMFNTPIDSAGRWNVNTFTNMAYANNVGFVSMGRSWDSEKNTIKDMTIGERLSGSYRNDWLEVELDGSLNYRRTRNHLQRTGNMDTWQYSYGTTINATAPWGTALSCNLHMNSRRGYSDQSLNTNELVWNAQLSQTFLKGRPLVVMLQFYDILHQQSNLSRSINAMMRSDTEYNSINSYVMLHVSYRLNLFGTRAGRRGLDGESMGSGNNYRRKSRERGGFGGGGHGGGAFGRPRF